ncbi:endonuclease V [Acinetobacter calcoaceticus]|uniref:Endonuclease V n=1 Tax=Acinetobacter calcoaceticus TaxID=471 RepID=A0A4R1XYG6_ACICA|nr:endonuclease V [Acinetobacter calcoaceticus]
MIVAIDVGYQESTALVAALVFEHWQSQTPVQEYRLKLNDIAEYEAGAFYKRELPCILAILQSIQHEIDCIVIDGYVFLGEDQTAGLGHYLWEALGQKVPIIGVAKNFFKGTPKACEMLRGKSIKPLYVTAIGIEQSVALQSIQSMFGQHRIPNLLKRVDQMSREQNQA